MAQNLDLGPGLFIGIPCVRVWMLKRCHKNSGRHDDKLPQGYVVVSWQTQVGRSILQPHPANPNHNKTLNKLSPKPYTKTRTSTKHKIPNSHPCLRTPASQIQSMTAGAGCTAGTGTAGTAGTTGAAGRATGCSGAGLHWLPELRFLEAATNRKPETLPWGIWPLIQ